MERLIWSITSASFCADGVEGGVEGWLCANAGGIKPPPRRRTTRMTRTTRQRNARPSSGVAFEPRFMTALLLLAEDLDDPPRALHLAPGHNLQIEHKDRIKHRYEQERDERRHSQSSNLRIAKRLPQRPAVNRERVERQDRRAHRDHHRSQPDDTGVEQCLLERLTLLMHLLDEIEEHDHVAHNHANQ